MNLSDATLHILEFDKLREGISIRAASTLGQEEILAMKPSSDTEIIQTRMNPVVEATHMIVFDDPVSLRRVPDIRSSLEGCLIPGSMLLVLKLLQMGEVLSGTRRLYGYISILHSMTSSQDYRPRKTSKNPSLSRWTRAQRW